MMIFPMRQPGICWRLLWLVAIAMVLLPGGSLHAASKKEDAARELDVIQKRIRSLETDVSKAAASRSSASKALRDAERMEAEARRALEDIRRRLAAGQQREQELRAAVSQAEGDLAGQRAMLGSQLRLVWTGGREEWLRLALSQEDPLVLARRTVYYRYITQQRQELLKGVEQELARLGSAVAGLDEQLAELAALDAQQAGRVRELAAAREVRSQSLQTLERELESQQTQLGRLRKEAKTLSNLMARLERESRKLAARQDKPRPAPGPALQLSDLPLRGRVLTRFGQPRAEGLLRWDGLLLEADAGSEVRAVEAGHVAYADWLPGMGLLLVIDHGKGLMSLYGHNEQLLKSAGDAVAQGEVISRVGDSGGAAQSGLYFEVRRNGKPVDPAGWIR